VRRVRVTLRCLSNDLGIKLPGTDVDLGALDHELLAEARRVAPHPETHQDRVLAIQSPRVYKIRHSRWRGATWLDRTPDLFWLLAAGIREEGSGTDPYVHFEKLADAGHLLPTDDDGRRFRAEWATRLADALEAGLVQGLAAARAAGGTDHRFVIEGIHFRLHVVHSDDMEEIWIAIRTVDEDGQGVKPQIRDLAFALLEKQVGDSDWEHRPEWPTGTLHGCEVAKLGVAAKDEPD
jgi:hypothetical protein